MHIKKNRGSNLVEYVIPIALVGIVIGVGLNNLFTNNSLLNYIMSSGNLKLEGDILVMKPINDGTTVANTQSDSDTTQTNTDSTQTNTDGTQANTDGTQVNTDGTQDNTDGTQTNTDTSSSSASTASCSSNSCSIDLGDVSLTGVPQNLAKYVETTGSSAGTQKIMQLFEQIATQLESQGDVEGSKLYRDLANLGYFNATIQLKSEEMAKSCSSSSLDSIGCLQNKLKQTASYDLPSSVSGILTNYNSSSTTVVDFSNKSTDLGLAKYTELKNPSSFNSLKTEYPAYAMLDIYNQIMSNSSFSSSLKNVTKELYKNINSVSFQRAYALADYSTYSSSNMFNTTAFYTQYDPFTGSVLNANTVSRSISSTLTEILKPKTSTNTNLSSTLVCVSGDNTSDGSTCK